MKKAFVALVAAALVLFGALVPLLCPRPSKVTKAAFDRIEVGTSREEAEAILGGPPGDYTTRPSGPTPLKVMLLIEPSWRVLTEDELARPHESLWWHGDEGTIRVAVDAEGIVRDKEFTAAPPSTAGLVETAQWRFERWRERVLGPRP